MDSYQAFGGALFAMLGMWSFVGLGLYVWYLWTLSRLFPLIGLPANHGWIPIWSQWQLIQRAGLPGWTAVFMIVPVLNIVTLVFSIMAIHRLNIEHREGPAMTVLGAFVPPLWAMFLTAHLTERGVGPHPYTGTIPAAQYPHEYQAPQSHGVYFGDDGNVYPRLDAAQSDPNQQAPAAHYRPAAPHPASPLREASPIADPSAEAQPTASHPNESAPVPAPKIPGRPQYAMPPVPPLPPIPEQPVTEEPFDASGQQALDADSESDIDAAHTADRPYSWPEERTSGDADAAHEGETTHRVAEPAPEGSESAAGGANGASGSDDEDLDRTVVVPRRTNWVLELPDGSTLALTGADIVVGRKPSPVEFSSVLIVPDATRTLSKSHARLRRDGETWKITDLESTNGVFLLTEAGDSQELEPNVEVDVTPRFVLGTLEVTLRTAE